MSVKFDLDYSEIEDLQEKFKKIPDNVENIINSYLHVEGVKKVADGITDLIPVSKRNKRHAKFYKWWRSKPHNLGFTVQVRGGKGKYSYGYLYFPDQGHGKRNPVEQLFMKRGLESATPSVVEELNERIDRKIEEELL